MILLPVFYFPPIPWFVAALREEKLYLDLNQAYRKQRYFSRMDILGPNQVITLSLPVERRSKRIPIKDKRISFAENWQKQHWRSLYYSYKNSPYFPYYSDILETYYEKQQAHLGAFLLEGIHICFSMLGHSPDIHVGELEQSVQAAGIDYRKEFHTDPSSLPGWFKPRAYEQVFEGFTPGLSILDLLFNLGPESRSFLKDSFVDTHGDHKITS